KLPALSSAGKIYLAFGEHHIIEEWQKEELSDLSEDQQVALNEEIKKVHEENFAYASEPLIEHISSFSIPILAYENKIVGCVTVVSFHTQIPKDANNEPSIIVQKEVKKSSQSFGYHI